MAFPHSSLLLSCLDCGWLRDRPLLLHALADATLGSSPKQSLLLLLLWVLALPFIKATYLGALNLNSIFPAALKHFWKLLSSCLA